MGDDLREGPDFDAEWRKSMHQQWLRDMHDDWLRTMQQSYEEDFRHSYEEAISEPCWTERRQEFIEHTCEWQGRRIGTVREYLGGRYWAAALDPFQRLGPFPSLGAAKSAVLAAASQPKGE